MRIAVSSQNLRTVTAHAGKTTRFFVFESSDDGTVREVERLELPREMMMHSFVGDGPHPLQNVQVLVTGGAGDGFVRRLGTWGVRVAITNENDPVKAATAFVRGDLEPVAPGSGGHHAPGKHGLGGCGQC